MAHCPCSNMRLASGMAADFITVNLDRPALSGIAYDPVAALIFCMVDRVDYSFIHGREVLNPEGLLTLELPVVVEKHGVVARSLVT